MERKRKQANTKTCQLNILYSTISFNYKYRIETFSYIQKLKEVSTSRPASKGMLKDVLQVEGRWH